MSFETKKTLAALEFGHIVISWLPPVWITPKIDLVGGAEGEIQAQVTATASEYIDTKASVRYEDGQWTPEASEEHSFEYQLPTLNASVSVKVYAGPKLSLTVDGLAGPYGQADGYLQLDADVNANLWWELDFGIEAFVGLESELLDMDYHSDDLIGFKTKLADAGGPFGEQSCTHDCTNKECGPDGCGGSSGSCPEGQSCQDGKCVEGCTPKTSEELGWECGSGDDGCGGTLDCGVASQTRGV